MQPSFRESFTHYLGIDSEQRAQALEGLGLTDFSELMGIDPIELLDAGGIPVTLSETESRRELMRISEANSVKEHFIGDGLPVWKVQSVVNFILGLRRLGTAYTPYQPERSQGTLQTQWIYQCLMAQITGFEAVNASLYDEATAIFEGICCATRLKRKKNKVLIASAIFPGSIEVIKTMAQDTDLECIWVPAVAETGLIDFEFLKSVDTAGAAALVYPQTNTFGCLEDVNALTDWAHEKDLLAIGIIDPMLLATKALKPPTEWGETGADIIVGEAQHTAIGPNFGGPGLGLFGVRLNAKNKNHIRQTPGRFVGEGKDFLGRDCHVMVLSTREQHIRRDKATSNICSNQAFLATIAGAAMLQRGESGWAEAVQEAYMKARGVAARLQTLEGVDLAYPESAFFNSVTVKFPTEKLEALKASSEILFGVDVTERIPGAESGVSYFKMSFSDIHDAHACNRLIALFEGVFEREAEQTRAEGVCDVPEALWRSAPVGLPDLSLEEIKEYYHKLDTLNIAPEDTCYPLGSCTMKYNPYLNEWAAGLPGFTDLHPQVPLADAQGALEIIYETQNWFKAITGLAGITTQPVAGAQGELVGLKLFQAYHNDTSETERDIVIIPKSAHGTNFATAIVAGYPDKKLKERPSGIVLLNADATGRIDMAQLGEILEKWGQHVAGIMVTNPNTGGVLENNFREMAEQIHAVGGLVYMDGANMNAVAGWLNLGALGVDAVHNNTHKTWSIPHGGGGPGDAFVGVSEKLLPYLPGHQIEKNEVGVYEAVKAEKSIGSIHRHWGNFAHKVRAFAYLLRLGREGVPAMSATAVLAARYLRSKLADTFPMLPEGADSVPRMHEFIITLPEDDFLMLEEAGIARGPAIVGFGKLLLDFGYHAPTVAFPEVLGLMFEPTESYTLAELDRLADAILAVRELYLQDPRLLAESPWLMPIKRVDEVAANRNVVVSRSLSDGLPNVPQLQDDTEHLWKSPIADLKARISEVAKASAPDLLAQ
ncbi:MAG: aminomethyl-transferring glycine dehydrogenase subunit GcvPB [Opitutales bacterium]